MSTSRPTTSHWLAKIISKLPDNRGWYVSVVIGDIIIGVLGGLLGGWFVFYFFHIGDPISGINVMSILVAFAGAILLILILRMLGGRERDRVHDG